MKKFFRKVSGIALLIVGLVVSIPVLVPGWGLPFIIAGLAILAPEYEWARKLHQKALDLYHRILAKVKPKRAEGSKKILVLLVAAVLWDGSLSGPVFCAEVSDSRRTAIVTAVEKVLPATVTIGAKRLAVQRVNPFRNMHDDFFSDWFSDPFFGGFKRMVKVPTLGSGILVDRRGLVLTNDHVVADAEEIMVTLSDGRTIPARLKGRGIPLDLALLELNPSGSISLDLPYVTLGTAEDLSLGEWAVAIGAPSNLEASVTAGVISAVGRRLPSKQDYTYLGMIQTDASINPGNSGGPLVNADGRVVGINTVIISQSGGSEGLGFAIPADQARKVLDDLLAAGHVRTAWFGWDLEEDKNGEGPVVKRVYEPSPAASAGVRAGAVLRALNSRPIRHVEDYEKILLTIRIGQRVSARLVDGGLERVAQLEPQVIPESLTRVNLGLVVENVSARYRRLAGGGVVVRQIDPEGVFGHADSASPLEPGDILIGISGQKVDSVEDYESIAGRLKKGSRVEFTIRRQNVIYTFSLQV